MNSRIKDPSAMQEKVATRTGLLRRVEQLLLAVGVILLAIYGAARIHSYVSSRRAIERFKATYPPASPKTLSPSQPQIHEQVDFSLWSEKRIRDYKESLLTKTDLPMAVLQIPKLHLEVPVFDGTDDLTLNRGLGWIEGTAKPGDEGNVGLAGHRDGFFRGLKDVVAGDQMQLSVADRTDTYVIDHIQIVSPDEVSVLEPSFTSSLTLVTCYPFYFIGSAPQRYIVHASLAGLVNNAKTADHE